ncbi:DUF6098 family protein [Amycolatopsis dongchuanensis]|uniref:Uncharacterized protein n=1 Tax=Amycolatopsis dongchuanensis TaxID=1070866 RepID=A0ABP8VB59_9PSEU
MKTVLTLDQLVDLFQAESGQDLYVRWSKGPEADMSSGGPGPQASRDALTGMALPGLSASPLKVEPWWDDRPLRLWLARRIYDYRHLRELRGPGVRPWVFQGTEIARGPDNEPLVVCDRPLAWLTDDVLHEAQELVDEQGSREWGPMDRSNAT